MAYELCYDFSRVSNWEEDSRREVSKEHGVSSYANRVLSGILKDMLDMPGDEEPRILRGTNMWKSRKMLPQCFD